MSHDCNECGVPLAGMDSVDGVCMQCRNRAEADDSPAAGTRIGRLMQQYGDASFIAASVVDQVLARDSHGQQKYGVSLDRGDLSIQDWLQHMTEELLDGAHYALCIKREFRRELAEMVVVAVRGLEGAQVDQSLSPTEAFQAGVKAVLDHVGVDDAKWITSWNCVRQRVESPIRHKISAVIDTAFTNTRLLNENDRDVARRIIGDISKRMREGNL